MDEFDARAAALNGLACWMRWCDCWGEPGQPPEQTHAQLVGGENDGKLVRYHGGGHREIRSPARGRGFSAVPVPLSDMLSGRAVIDVDEYRMERRRHFSAATTKVYVLREPPRGRR